MKRNVCLVIIRKAKKDYYNKLTVRYIMDNKQLWKSVKSFFFFSNKVTGNEKKLEDRRGGSSLRGQ